MMRTLTRLRVSTDPEIQERFGMNVSVLDPAESSLAMIKILKCSNKSL